MHQNSNVVASLPYFQDKFIWCIQRSGKIPIWVNFFFMIPLWIWIFFLLISVVLCSVLIFVLFAFDENYRFRIHRYDYFYCLLLVVIPSYAATSGNFRPANFNIRMVYWMLLTCPWFFHLMIGAFMYQYMNYQFYYHQIATNDEMLGENFRLTGSIEVFNMIKYNEMVRNWMFSNKTQSFSTKTHFLQYAHEMIDNFHVCDDINTCLTHLKRPENYKMAVGDSRFHLLSSSAYSPSSIHCFDDSESISTYQVALFHKKDSQIEAMINRIIRNLFEFGIFNKWSQTYLRKKHIDSDEIPPQMTVQHLLLPIIFLMGTLIPLATIVFVLELVTFAKIKQRRPSRAWSFSHRMLTAERFYFQMKWFIKYKNSRDLFDVWSSNKEHKHCKLIL